MGVSTDQSTSTGSGSDPNTHTESASTITSSASRGGDAINSSMVLAVSTVNVQEKHQMNVYRAEVEALMVITNNIPEKYILGSIDLNKLLFTE